MADISFGKYLCKEDIDTPQTAVINSPASAVSKNFDGKDVVRYELEITLQNGEVKTYSPNVTSLKSLAGMYGKNTDNWVGKSIRLEVLSQVIRGERKSVIYASPVFQQEVVA